MPDPADLEARLTAVEARLEEVAADAAVARHLAAARDRDIADLGIKVDANRAAISALGEQTRARFDAMDRRLDGLETQMRTGFTEVRGRLDAATAGLEHITGLLTRLIEDQGEQ